MKQLTQKLDDLFSEFDSGDSINLPVFKREIMDLVASTSAEYDKLAAESEEHQNLKKETIVLRSIILEECRAKMILTNESDVEYRLESFKASSAEELQSLRESVLKRFDSKFRLIEKNGEIGLTGDNTLLKNLQAYQS